MNTDNYGDVLAIPGSVTPDQYGDFFEPLGTQEEIGAGVPVDQRQVLRGQVVRHPRRRQRPGLRLQQARLGGGRDHRVPRHPRGVPRRAPGHQGQRRRGRAAVHQLQGRLAAVAVGRLARRGHGRPRLEEQDRRVRHPVDRGQRLRRGRRPDLRRRRAGPDGGRPDDHQLGGVEAAPRHRRGRDDGPRLVGHPADGSGRGGGRRERRGHRATPRRRSGRRQVPLRRRR